MVSKIMDLTDLVTRSLYAPYICTAIIDIYIIHVQFDPFFWITPNSMSPSFNRKCPTMDGQTKQNTSKFLVSQIVKY